MEKVIFDEFAISRTLRRITHELLEKNQDFDSIVLVGIKTRGEFLARKLCELIKAFEGIDVDCLALDISNYRDDVKRDKEEVVKRQDLRLNNKKVVLVDDVLYTGRTVRAAFEAILEYGRPQSIQLAVLIDRGHRELPIRADYIGKNIPTSKRESVNVFLKEVDGKDCVVLKSE